MEALGCVKKNQMKKVKPRPLSFIQPWERNKNVSGSYYSHFEIEGDVIEIAAVKRINDRETVRESHTEPEISAIQTESDKNIIITHSHRKYTYSFF